MHPLLVSNDFLVSEEILEISHLQKGAYSHDGDRDQSEQNYASSDGVVRVCPFDSTCNLVAQLFAHLAYQCVHLKRMCLNWS